MKKLTYVIAEAGVNHNGSKKYAFDLIDAAKEAGADAIKFQLFNAQTLTTKCAPQAEYQQKNAEIQSQFDMLKGLELPQKSFLKLKNYSEQKALDFIVTPFDLESLKFIHQVLNLQVIKIGSGDLTNGPLLLAAGQTQANIILSTGMSNLSEIEDALKVIAFGYLESPKMPTLKNLNTNYAMDSAHDLLQKRVTLLHCTSEYPAPFEEINLKAMSTLSSAFNLNTGLSDHSIGFEVSLAATALGATMIEKHFTLDKNMKGPDHLASLDVMELKEMVKGIRNIEKALGCSRKCATKSEIKNANVIRRSIVASQAIQQGDVLTNKNLGIKRPFDGLSPMLYWELLGKKAQKNYLEDEVIS